MTSPDPTTALTKSAMIAALQGVAQQFKASLTIMREDGYCWLEFYDADNGADDFGGMDVYQELSMAIKDATGRDFYFNKARIGEVSGALDADLPAANDTDVPAHYTIAEGGDCCIADLGHVITEVKAGRRPPRL